MFLLKLTEPCDQRNSFTASLLSAVTMKAVMGKLVRIAVEDITCQSFGEILEQSFQYTASDIGAWSVGFYYLLDRKSVV